MCKTKHDFTAKCRGGCIVSLQEEKHGGFFSVSTANPHLITFLFEWIFTYISQEGEKYLPSFLTSSVIQLTSSEAERTGEKI